MEAAAKFGAKAFHHTDGVLQQVPVQGAQRGAVHGARPTFKLNAGNIVWSQAHAVPGKFECWRLRVNATPHKALAEYGC